MERPVSFKKYGSKYLKGLRNFRASHQTESLAIRDFLQALDCPRSLAVWLLYESGEHQQLLELPYDPLHFNSVREARDSYLATEFLSKFTGLVLDRDLDEVAFTKFREFEALCKETNGRFRNLSSDPKFKGPIVWLHNATIRKIDRILGDFSPEELITKANWGPGASTLIKRRDASPARKFQFETGITRDLFDLIPPTLLGEAYPAWSAHLVEQGFPNFQVGNKVITVPKSAKTNRVIAIEPGINLWFQLAIGDMVRERLLRFGIDTRNQGANQRLAQAGSITGKLTTVDFSSASDSISAAVVEELLPPRWFLLLDSCRSKYGFLKDDLIRWEKFSSMGNGFTFPLQTLIFFAAAEAVKEYLSARGKVSAYGDDVIIPTSCFELFSKLVDFYGFRINGEKTHHASPFRESCGAHFYLGFDLKPLYLKDRVSDVPSIYRLANAVRRLAHRGMYFSCDARFRTMFEHLVHSVPVALRLRIPDSLGDGGFISNFDEASPSLARNHPNYPQYEGWIVPHLVERAKCMQFELPGYLYAELWHMSKRDTDDLCVPELPSRVKAIRRLTSLDRAMSGRNAVHIHSTSLSVSKALVTRWDNLGPWISPYGDTSD